MKEEGLSLLGKVTEEEERVPLWTLVFTCSGSGRQEEGWRTLHFQEPAISLTQVLVSITSKGSFVCELLPEQISDSLRDKGVQE